MSRFLSLLLMIALPGVARAQIDYFPLYSDASWTYGGNPMEIARTVTMRESDDTYLWTGPFGNQNVRLTEGGILEQVSDSGTRQLVDFGAEEGATWVIRGIGWDDLITGSTVTVASRSATKSVSFGDFASVIHLEVAPPAGLADAGLTDLWFAPKVGLIAYSEITFAGPQTYELAAMAVPGEGTVSVPDPEPPILVPIPVDPEDRFPIQIGLTWSYVGPFEDERLIRTLEATEVGDELALVLDGFFGNRTLRSQSGRIEQFSSGSWSLLFDMNAQVDEFWTIDLESPGSDFLDGARVEVIERSGRLEVPYGAFGDVTHLRVTPPSGLADAGLTDLWIAPGIGIVAWTEQSITGPRTYSLVSFANRFEPEPFPLPGPFPDPIIPPEEFVHRAEMTHDEVVYELATTSASIRQGEGVFVSFTAVGLEGERTYHFTSTQQVEFVLTNASGETAWLWSAARGFGDALTEFTLAAGDTVRKVERVDLSASSIDEGAYTLKGYFPTASFDAPTVAASDTEVSLEITVEANPDLATLEGVVVDEVGSPIAEAVVHAEIVGGDVPPGVAFPAIASFTDREGRFLIGRVIPGTTYRLIASRRGYTSASQTVEAVSGVNSVEIRMRARDVSDFENAHAVTNSVVMVEVALDRFRYAGGDTMNVRYSATNISERALPMRFPSGQEFDLQVTGINGVVWTWSATRLFPQVVTDTELGAGESFTFEVSEVVPSSWSGNGSSLGLDAYLALFDLSEEGGLSRELTRGYVKFGFADASRPDLPTTTGPVHANLSVDRSVYASTDSIVVDYALKNVSEQTIELGWPSGQRFDLMLTDGESREPLWTWSANKSFILATHAETVAPGDAYSFREVIRLPELGIEPDGVLVLQAYLAIADEMSDIRTEDTRAGARLWVGSRPPAEEPPVPVSRVNRDLDVRVAADSVHVTYTVRNDGGKEIQTVFSSGQSFDILVHGETGVVWQWSEGKGFTAAVREEVLAAGESLTFQEAFVLPEESVMLEVEAFLTVSDGPGGNLIPEETRVRQRLFVQTDGGSSSDMPIERRSDFDGSGEVDFSDFLSFAIAFGTQLGDFSYEPSFDLDADGQVGFSDFLSFASVFGTVVPSF